LVINYADVSLNPLKLAQALTRMIKNISKIIGILMGVGGALLLGQKKSQ
jgi:hypothetical protein